MHYVKAHLAGLGVVAIGADTAALIRHMRSAPVALSPATANEQHYELPAEFFRRVLGPRLKYSSGLWAPGVTDLAAAVIHAVGQEGYG